MKRAKCRDDYLLDYEGPEEDVGHDEEVDEAGLEEEQGVYTTPPVHHKVLGS